MKTIWSVVILLIVFVMISTPASAGDLSINARLNCMEGFDGGYSNCEVYIDYTVTLDYSISTDVGVECSVDYEYKEYRGFLPSSGHETTYDTVYTTYGSGSGSTTVHLSMFAFKPIISVRVTGVECWTN